MRSGRARARPSSRIALRTILALGITLRVFAIVFSAPATGISFMGIRAARAVCALVVTCVALAFTSALVAVPVFKSAAFLLRFVRLVPAEILYARVTLLPVPILAIGAAPCLV